MTKQEIFQKMIDCHRIADEVCADAYKLDADNNRWEIICQAELCLDAIDSFMNYLRGFGVED